MVSGAHADAVVLQDERRGGHAGERLSFSAADPAMDDVFGDVACVRGGPAHYGPEPGVVDGHQVARRWRRRAIRDLDIHKNSVAEVAGAVRRHDAVAIEGTLRKADRRWIVGVYDAAGAVLRPCDGLLEIGRASCRGRVWGVGGGGRTMQE